MDNLIIISLANDACLRKLREVFAVAHYLRQAGFRVEVVVDSYDETDYRVPMAA